MSPTHDNQSVQMQTRPVADYAYAIIMHLMNFSAFTMASCALLPYVYRPCHILAAFYVAICATAASSGANVAQDDGNLLAIAGRLGKGEPVRRTEVAEAFDKMESSEAKRNMPELFEQFRQKLNNVSIGNLRVDQLEGSINQVWECFCVLQNYGNSISSRFAWDIRFDAIRWVRNAVATARKMRPLDKRTWPQKWGNVKLRANGDFNSWEAAMKRIERLYVECIRRTGYEIRECECTQEFKDNLTDEFEAIIGRPMTDADTMFRNGK